MVTHEARRDRIEELRARVAGVTASSRPSDALAFGIDEVDRRLADGGLARAALHEFAAAATSLADDAAATLFIAGAAARFAEGDGTVVWALSRPDLYAPGLEQAGLAPDRVIFVEAQDDREVLAVVEDALRHGALAAVVGEVRRADMTVSRRLQLAAAEGSTAALLLRRRRRAGACPLADPSTAATRWRIACAPSGALGIPGVGRARWNVELARQRNGASFNLVLEGCDAKGRLALPAAAAHRAVAEGGPVARAA